MLVDMKLADFTEALGARTPTPGGGSASAAAAAMGAALGVMAARFSEGPEAVDAASETDGIKRDLLALVDRDAQAYDRISSAYGLPRGTEEEKKRRTAAIQEALVGAAEAPLHGMRVALRGLASLKRFAPRCNKNLLSDLAGGATLLYAGIVGCGHNVEVNAIAIKDGEIRRRLMEEFDRLRQEGALLADEVHSLVQVIRAGR